MFEREWAGEGAKEVKRVMADSWGKSSVGGPNPGVVSVLCVVSV